MRLKIDFLYGYSNILDAFEKLKNSFFDFSGNLSEYVKKISNNGVIMAAYDEMGKVCALIAFYSNNIEEKVAFLTSVLVREDRQGQGLGTALLNEFEKYSINAGMKELRLEVNKRNQRAITIYKKCGYTEYQEKEDTIIMKKDLKHV